MTDLIGTTEARLEGFYWVILGQNPPEIAYWERGEWWLAGDPQPWHPVVGPMSDRSAATGEGRGLCSAKPKPATANRICASLV